MSPYEQNASLLDWLQGSEHRAPSNAVRSSRNRLSMTGEHSPEPGLASDAAISLKDMLRNDPWTHNEVPEAIHLPDSHASSSTVNENPSGLNMPNDSLVAFLHSDGPVVPSMVPLLGPILSSTSSPQAEDIFFDTGRTGRIRRPRTRKKKRTTRFSYDKTIENAGRFLGHIKHGNVGKDSRQDKASVIYYDYTDSSRSSAVHIMSSGRIANLGYPPPNFRLRLLVVEDLTNSTINALGETFSINHEFFEEHLLSSGYAGADYNMMPSRSWATGSLEKSYFSMRWIRPVFRQPMYSSSRSMKDLVKASTRMTKRVGPVVEISDEDDSGQDDKIGVEHFTTTVSTNIFRLDWPLWTNPAKTANMKRESAGWKKD
ncbi:Mg2+ transporter protein CorA-like/Zinc transport protein ZntB [Penicillium waksmanii]|uniref:Mg2+ transporter protein CorA-like/Zinc transport protein ZntB n=1 Tax=Penicillium waksmanii TaxID=69791 RepID=UPI0025478402|nr:Mg2+ transporter protein CorA-like/Zinc transport protein ZntB [Penicillium waksmanii]KAJ5983393.1 Mg2+ transporter protein CorA-like/Zinc transport protein ZntB [Penicillium waksmanii]